MKEFHAVIFCFVSVFFQTVLPRSGGFSSGDGLDAVTYTVRVNHETDVITDIKAHVHSIWTKG